MAKREGTRIHTHKHTKQSGISMGYNYRGVEHEGREGYTEVSHKK